jgi:hypothetical protein
LSHAGDEGDVAILAILAQGDETVDLRDEFDKPPQTRLRT